MSGAVLVAGAGGFVGSAVVRALVRAFETAAPRFCDGAPVERVVALLRPGGSMERLQELPRSPRWSVERADAADPSALRAALERVRPRAILHVALDKAVYGELPETEQRRLVDRPLEVLFDGLAGIPGGRLIHTGSAWVLPAGEALAEDSEVAPQSPYGRAKLREDRLIPVLHKKTGVAWINLRLFNMFGKYESRSRLLPHLVERLSQGQVAELSHGNQVRDFNDVDDMAQAFRLALEADEAACGTIYHIGTGRGLTTRAFAMTVAEVTGNADLIRFGGRRSSDQDLACLVSDPALARRALGWSPPADVEGRIRHAAEWWLARSRDERGGEPRGASGARAARPGAKTEGFYR